MLYYSKYIRKTEPENTHINIVHLTEEAKVITVLAQRIPIANKTIFCSSDTRPAAYSITNSSKPLLAVNHAS